MTTINANCCVCRLSTFTNKSVTAADIKPTRVFKNPTANPSAPSYIQGYKNRPNFLKFGENRRNRADPNLKIVEITFHCFKISEKIKIAKYM
jgi:hypothetical protein